VSNSVIGYSLREIASIMMTQ